MATGLQERLKLCSHSIVKWPEVVGTFRLVDYIREMTANKPCDYGDNGSFSI